MDATSPLRLSPNHTLLAGDGTCADIHVITDAEWSSFPPTRLVILDTQPATCTFHWWWSRRDEAYNDLFVKCAREYDPIPF